VSATFWVQSVTQEVILVRIPKVNPNYALPLSGSIPLSGTLTAARALGFPGSIGPDGALGIALARALTGSVTPGSTLSAAHLANVTLSGSVLPSGLLDMAPGRSFGGAISLAGTLSAEHSGGGGSYDEVIYGNSEIDLGQETDFIKTMPGGSTQLGPGDYFISTNGAQVTNYGTLLVVGEAELQGSYNTTNSQTGLLNISATGVVQVGVDPVNDDPSFTFGNGSIWNVDGRVTLLGSAFINGDQNEALVPPTVHVAAGAVISTTSASNASVGILYDFEFTGTFNIPDDNSTQQGANSSFGDTGQGAGVLSGFTHAPGSGHTVNFTDISIVDGTTGNITTWAWLFGDSGTDSTQNPSHTYAAAGNYQVILTVTTSGGSVSSTQVNLTVA
jgi:hypothetical protein